MIDQRVKYFITVIEEGSFSAAARKLYLSQPALSKQISNLERDINVRLLDRTTYRPTLTKAGEIYYEHVLELNKKYEEMLKNLRKHYQKQIRIAFTGTQENRRIAGAIHAIKASNPLLHVTFLQYNFQESLENLMNNEVEISFGIESTFKNNPYIKYDVLFEYEMCVICSYDHPFAQYSAIDVSMLKQEKIFILSKKFGRGLYASFMEACKNDGYKPNVVKEVDSFDELVFDVSIGEGIAIVSKDVVSSKDVKILDLINSHHASSYVVAYHRSNKDKECLKFIEDIKDYFKHYNFKL